MRVRAVVSYSLLVATLAVQTPIANAQRANYGMIPIQTSPGKYEQINQAQLLKYQLDFSKGMQAQDQKSYEEAQSKLNEAYLKLNGDCASSDYHSCTGLQKLFQFSILSQTNQIASLPVGDLTAAIRDFQLAKANFLQSLAATEVLHDVWASMGADDNRNPAKLTYYRGSINLKVLTDTYRKSVANMETQAQAFQYTYFNGNHPVTTLAGQGLNIPDAVANPAILAERLKQITSQWAMNTRDLQTINALHYNMAAAMVQFKDANGKKLVWYTSGQNDDKQEWVKSIQNRARIMKWVRGVYCMPLGVPAVDIPEPSRFNLDFLTLGLEENQFRIAQAAERNSDHIRAMVTRLDRVLVSMQSKAGELNHVGGLMGYVNAVNAIFAWHNQVEANLNVIKILREMFVDELDIMSADPAGCDKVRARYNAAYGSFRDPSFQSNVLDRYLGGTQFGADGDPTFASFNRAGSIITTKGDAYQQYRNFIRENPSASAVGNALKNSDPDLK